MNAYVQNWTYLTTGLVQMLFFLALIPQIIVNYKAKSAYGMSDFMLCGLFLGYFWDLFYFFSSENFTLAYKIKTPLAIIAVCVLIYQRIYYSKTVVSRLRFFKIMGIALTISCVLVFLIFKSDFSHELSFGWIATTVWSTYQLPQIIRIFVNKSVAGFSLGFVIVLLFACGIELVNIIVLHLSLPYLIGVSRAILANGILALQFWIYRH